MAARLGSKNGMTSLHDVLSGWEGYFLIFNISLLINGGRGEHS